MTYDERWLEGVLARGQVRVVGSGGAGVPGRESADTPGRVRPHVSEAAFQAAVVRVAKDCGWDVWHPYSAKRSAPGYFDLTIAKAGQPIILSELKTATGVVTIEQQHWYDTVRQATGVECYIWRPDDMAEIVEKLLRK
jgi:hypothetical protein